MSGAAVPRVQPYSASLSTSIAGSSYKALLRFVSIQKGHARYSIERIINMLRLPETATTMQKPTVKNHSGSKYWKTKNYWRTKKQKNKQDCTPQGGASAESWAASLCFLCFLFLVLPKIIGKAKKQKQKKQDCTRQGRGVVADSRVLSSFCCFGGSWSCSCLLFFGLWSHSRKAKENLLVVAECQNAVKNRTPRVSPSEQNRGRSALFTSL